jgi:hypothetical protein
LVPGIDRFIKDRALSPEIAKIVGEAYDRVLKSLHDRGQPVVVQEIIAERILDLANSGERDPQKVASIALKSLGIITP